MPSFMRELYKKFERTCYYREIERKGCFRTYRTDCGRELELSYNPSEVVRYCSHCGKVIRVFLGTRRSDGRQFR